MTPKQFAAYLAECEAYCARANISLRTLAHYALHNPGHFDRARRAVEKVRADVIRVRAYIKANPPS